MKFCYNCGAKIEEGDKFCVECGAELKLVDVEEPQFEEKLPEIEEQLPQAEKQPQVIEEQLPKAEYQQKEIVEQLSEIEAQLTEHEEPLPKVEEKQLEEEQPPEIEEQPSVEEELTEVEEQLPEILEQSPEIGEKPSKEKLGKAIITGVILGVLIALVAITIVFIISHNDKDKKAENDQSDTREQSTVSITGAVKYRPGEKRFCFYDVLGNELLNSNDILSISAVKDTGSNSYIIMIDLTEDGAGKYAEAVKDNIGRSLIFRVDHEIVAAPYIQSESDSGSIQVKVQAETEAVKIVDAFYYGDTYIPTQKHEPEVAEWCFIPEQKVADFSTDRSYILVDADVEMVRDINIEAGHVDGSIEWEEAGIDDAADLFKAMGPGKAIEVSYVSSTGCMWLIIDGKRIDENFVTSKNDDKKIHLPLYNKIRNIAQFTYEDIVRDTTHSDTEEWGDRLYFEADGAWKVFSVRVIDSGNKASSSVENNTGSPETEDPNARVEIPVNDLPKYFAGSLTLNEIALIICALDNVSICFEQGQDGIHSKGSKPTRQEIFDYMFAKFEWNEIPDLPYRDGGSDPNHYGMYRIYSYNDIKTICLSVFEPDEFDTFAASMPKSNFQGEISKSKDIFTIWCGGTNTDHTFYVPHKAYKEGDTYYIMAGNVTVIGYMRDDGTLKLEYFGSSFSTF